MTNPSPAAPREEVRDGFISVPKTAVDMWRSKADDIDDDCKTILLRVAGTESEGMVMGVQIVSQEIRNSIDGALTDAQSFSVHQGAEAAIDAAEEIIHNYLFNAAPPENRELLKREISRIIQRHQPTKAEWVPGYEPASYGRFWVFIDPKDGGSTMLWEAKYLPSIQSAALGDGTGYWSGLPCIAQFVTYHMPLVEPSPPIAAAPIAPEGDLGVGK